MLTGEKVRLRAYRKEDIALVQELINEPDIRLNLSPAIPFPYTLEDEEKWYSTISATKDTYDFAIEDLETGLYLGGCGLNAVDWKNGHGTVGIFIGQEAYLGRGYGTDAMRVLVDFVFNETNLNKIRLNVFSFNERAIKSYKKCGFAVEGTLRQQVFRGGRYHDEVQMGLLRSEWAALKEKK